MNKATPENSEYPSKAQLKQLQKGESRAFAEIVRRYQDRVYAMIMRTVGDEAIARELSQETFLRAFKHIRSFRGEASLSTWLIRIGLNCTNTYFNSAAARLRASSESFDSQHIDQRSDVQESFSSLERIVVRRAVAELEPIYRSVVWLRSFEGLSYKEIGEVLDIAPGTVASRMNTALHKLKDKLGGEWS